MTITQDEKDLIIKITLTQKCYNVYEESDDNPDGYCGDCDNFIGMIMGDKFGFAQVIDLSYKDSIDYGGFIVELSEGMDLEEFKKICKEFDIYLFTYPVCGKCGKVLFGCFTWTSKGGICDECSESEPSKE